MIPRRSILDRRQRPDPGQSGGAGRGPGPERTWRQRLGIDRLGVVGSSAIAGLILVAGVGLIALFGGERFELDHLADRRPAQLSGGQAQRVALARALASDPEVLLLDEPLASLDAGIRDEVRADLARHLREFGRPTVVVTHDAQDVIALADEVVVLQAGRIVQQGSVDQLAARPATPYVARLFGT